ncbi:MAG: AEC family transporter [Deltaproteobacteria bacterium]|nr:AEC family transporter [Deltaproteobacteria bacterium]
MLDDFFFAFYITAPIFCILGLGIFFKRIGLITDEFARIGSDLVFKVTLPCLLFVKIVETDFLHDLPVNLIVYAVVATVLVFLLLDRLVSSSISLPGDRGVFVQGAYRSNMGIIGLAYCLSAYGEPVVAIVSIYLAVLTTLYNVLAVITLTRHQEQTSSQGISSLILKGIIKNPLILAISAAVAISLSGFTVPQILLNTGSYFAQMTLPLALLCAGASIRIHEFQTSPPLYWATGGKLFFVPLLITVGGIAIGLRGELLGVLFLMCAAPTAAASYPMAQSMGANHHLAAAIIAATSLGSIVSSTLGIFLLRVSGLI